MKNNTFVLTLMQFNGSLAVTSKEVCFRVNFWRTGEGVWPNNFWESADLQNNRAKLHRAAMTRLHRCRSARKTHANLSSIRLSSSSPDFPQSGLQSAQSSKPYVSNDIERSWNHDFDQKRRNNTRCIQAYKQDNTFFWIVDVEKSLQTTSQTYAILQLYYVMKKLRKRIFL